MKQGKSLRRMIGRKNELTLFKQACNEATDAHGAVLLVSGEAGIGKTRLAEYALEQSGLTVLTGRAIEEATPPYGPFASILRSHLRRTKRKSLVAGPLGSYLSLLLPELGPPPEEIDPDTLTEALFQALAKIAEKAPIALLLDDLQWADHASLELLPALAHRLENERILIVGTYRSDEILRGHPLRRLKNELRRVGHLRELALEPLDEVDSAALVARVLGAPAREELLAKIFEHTQGLPLFLEELSQALLAGGHVRNTEGGFELLPGETVPIPESVRDAVLLRVDALSDQARRVLEVASIAGMEFDLQLVAELAEDESGLEELIDRNLIVENERGRGEFRHALTREAIECEVLWSKRRRLHREIATALGNSSGDPGVIAEHWLAANESNPAREALLLVAENSCRVHAYLDATRAAERALEIWPDGHEEEERLEALERLASCAQTSGQLTTAVRALREVLVSPAIQGNHARIGEAQRRLATLHGLQGAWDQAMELRDCSARSFGRAELLGEVAIETLAKAGHMTATLQLASAHAEAKEAARVALEGHRLDVHVRAVGLQGVVEAMQGKFEDGRKTVQDGLSLALEHDLTEAASEAYRRLASVQDYASDYAGSREAYFTALDYCRAQGLSGQQQEQVCLGCMSWVLFQTGEWKRAMETCKEVLSEKAAPPGSKALAFGVLGLIQTHRGELKHARKNLQESATLSRQQQIAVMDLFLEWSWGAVEEQEGNFAAAQAHYDRLLEVREKLQDRHDSIPALFHASSFYGERGSKTGTAICANALNAIVAATGNTEAIASLAHALGETALLNEDSGEAARQFGAAIEQYEKLDVPLALATCEWRAGVAWSGSGKTDEAIRHWSNGYRLAKNIGARPLASRIASKLEKFGVVVEERGARTSDGGVGGTLTRRQVEVARLIAEGLTNKEIGKRLYLSTRTVDMHVANILNRLDCRSRSEAVRKVTDLGMIE